MFQGCAKGLAGTANSVIQPALAGLDDKDNLTYTGKEKIGEIVDHRFGKSTVDQDEAQPCLRARVNPGSHTVDRITKFAGAASAGVVSHSDS